LSPPILYELGLIPTFKWRLEQIEKMNHLENQLVGEEIKINIKKEITIFIYRIVNELLQNVLKHAQASKIILEIAEKNGKYLISVKDNGIGFNKEKLNGKKRLEGFGLISIKERLESLKGRLIIKSERGLGTNATIEIPVTNNKSKIK
jgi:signal transduction histidine kinase